MTKKIKTCVCAKMILSMMIENPS